MLMRDDDGLMIAHSLIDWKGVKTGDGLAFAFGGGVDIGVDDDDYDGGDIVH